MGFQYLSLFSVRFKHCKPFKMPSAGCQLSMFHWPLLGLCLHERC